MDLANDPFVEFLRERRGRKVYLKPYVGNSGDELIWMGNERLLKTIGLDRVLNPRKADIILWPGGNPTMWESNLEGWQDCWKRWPDAEFVVAPAGFRGRDLPWHQILDGTKVKITGLFAREPVGYQNLCRLNLPPAVKVGLGHDPAFHLKDSEWITELREACSSEYILASFRGDHESAMRLPELNLAFRLLPFSWVFRRYVGFRYRRRCLKKRLATVRRVANSTLPLMENDASMSSFQSFVECISRAAQVHTDRLHCMIMAVLLGKQVFAYPTAYSKLETVYEHSIKSWARVEFVKT